MAMAAREKQKAKKEKKEKRREKKEKKQMLKEKKRRCRNNDCDGDCEGVELSDMD